MTARDELIELVFPILEKCFDSDWNMTYSEMITDAILAAGYTKPRIINSADELLALPEASVVLDYEGDVSQKRGGLWCGYETAPINSNKLARIAGPFTVLYEPQP
jgi:hypothetical protein